MSVPPGAIIWGVPNSSRLSSIFVAALLLAGGLSSCSYPHQERWRLSGGTSAIPAVHAGHPIKLSVLPVARDLLAASKVEVQMDNAVPTALSELEVGSAKVELKPVIEAGSLSLEIPTTESFRPGIWHVSEMRFYMPDKKAWIGFREGADFAGKPFQVTNLTEEHKPSAALELVTIEMVGK